MVKAALVFLFLCGSAFGQRSTNNASPRFGIKPVSNPFKSAPARASAAFRPQAQATSFKTSGGPLVEILRSNQDGPNEDGSYSFGFETSDGTKREEQGRLTSPETYAISGSYSYTAPDGTLVEVKYIADENGYRAESPLIPAIPEHSLAQIRAAQQTGPQQSFAARPLAPRAQAAPRPKPQQTVRSQPRAAPTVRAKAPQRG